MWVKRLIFRAERFIGRFFYHRHIWLISDRKMSAGDNGEAFFKYLKDKNVDSIFAISKASSDYERLRNIGNVVDYDSLKYKFLLCVADCHCSSQLIHMECHTETPQIFLQHGVAFDNLFPMTKNLKHHNFFAIVSAEMESHEIIDAPKEYIDEHIWVTGLPRFDYLKNNPCKKIIIAFTWRYSFEDKTEDKIRKTGYFTTLTKIMSDEKLHDELSKRGYELRIKLHPEMERYSYLLNETDNCGFYSGDYNSMYKEASLMITDFSSSIADFAYLRKPIIYYQFDSCEFLGNNPYLRRGTFDYFKDGFGPVVETYDDLCSALIGVLDNDCKMENKYILRVDSYFKYNDKKNCDRIFKKICEILPNKSSYEL